MFGGEDGFTWLYMFDDGMSILSEFEIIDFQGGLYAVATDIDQKTDMDFINAEVHKFLDENGFKCDDSGPKLENIITSPFAHEIMGYDQMDYYFPIKG